MHWTPRCVSSGELIRLAGSGGSYGTGGGFGFVDSETEYAAVWPSYLLEIRCVFEVRLVIAFSYCGASS